MNDDRERWINQVMELTGEATKSGAIDVALQHYIADVRSKRAVATDLDAKLVEKLHTPFVPIERETSVGRDDG